MISPGTIRAASLVSKGVSPKDAIAQGTAIDNLTANRRAFLQASPSTTQGIASPTFSTTPIASSIAPTQAPSVETPSTTFKTPKGMSLGNVSSAFTESIQKDASNLTEEDVAKINNIASQVESPVQKKGIQVGNPNALVDPAKMQEGMAKLSPKELGKLNVDLQKSLIQAQIDSLPTNIGKTNYIPDEYKNKNISNELVTKIDKISVDLTPDYTLGNTINKEHSQKLSTYQSLVNGFLGSTNDLKSLQDSYKAITKELDFIKNEAKGFSDYQARRNNIPASTRYASLMPKVDSIRSTIDDIYNVRSQALLADQLLNTLENRYEQALKTNPKLQKDQFYKAQQEKYSSDKNPFGLGQVLVEEGLFDSYQDFIKFTNPGKYSDKFQKVTDVSLTGIDPAITNQADINSYGLQLSKIYAQGNIDQTRDRVSGDHRLQDVKDDIIFSGVAFNQMIAAQATQRSIDAIRQREQLSFDYTKKQAEGKLTKDDQAKYEAQLGALEAKIDYQAGVEKFVGGLGDYSKIKENQSVTNFAQDRLNFIDKQTKWNKLKNAEHQTSWYEDMGRAMYTGRFFDTQTGAYWQEAGERLYGKALGMGADVLKFTDQTVLNNFLGIPRSDAYKDRNNFYNYMRQRLDVPEVIDERASLLAGSTVTSTTAVYKNPNSWTGYSLSWSGLGMMAAETTPQVLAFAGAGRAVQSLAGSALKAGVASGATASLLGQANNAKFLSALSRTGSSASAWGHTFRTSNNVFLKNVLADRLPSAIGMTAVMYPEQYNRTLERLEASGVKNAHSIAANTALVSTGIELLAENIFPNLKYLDDFAEKGTGFKNLLTKKLGQKWVGNFDQYRALYSGILGNKLSEKSINYLARNSADLFGKIAAPARFYISRGTEEGLEEVFSELANFTLDATTNYANYRKEAPNTLSIEGMANAFLGGFAVPSAGGARQIKAYSENKKYGGMFDMMVNADYYRDKINQQFKEGKIDQKEASNMLGRLQELVAIADEYGVQNLKRNPKGAQLTADLVNSPEKQFDYFKTILKRKGIEEKLAKEGANLTDKERADLIAEGEEASKRIDKYKQQSDLFANLTQEEKDKIVQNTIDAKTKDAKFGATSEILAEAIEKTDIELAKAIKDGQPEHHIQAIRDYKDSLVRVSIQRSELKQQAIERGTYNPLTQAAQTEGDAVPFDGSSIESVEDAENVVVQAMLDPETGADVYFAVTGQTEQELEKLKKDKENLSEEFLDYLEANDTEPSETNPKQSVTTADNTKQDRVKYQTISDLTQEQQDLFEDIAEKMDAEIEALEKKHNKYQNLLTNVLTAAVATGKMSIEQQDKFADSILKKFVAVKKVGFSLTKNTSGVLFDTVTFAEHLAENADALSKEYTKIESQIEQEKQAEQVEREQVPIDDISPVEPVQEEEPVTVPELLPEDVSEEFAALLGELESIEPYIEESVESPATGEVTTVTTDNPRRTEIINTIMGDIVNTPSIEGAKAKMAALMQVLGKPASDIKQTLEQMDAVAANKPILEEDYTHMFELYQLARMTEDAPPSVEAVDSASDELGIVEEVTPEEAPVPPAEANIQETVDNQAQAVQEDSPSPVATEETKEETENLTRVVKTTPLFKPSGKAIKDNGFFESQARIIETINAEILGKKDSKGAIVDLFTMIEEVLGPEVLSAFEDIFNQVQSPTVTKEKLAELRNQFIGLFPANFLKPSAVEYMFDKQMVAKIAQSDITQKGKQKLDATDEELIEANRNNKVTLKLADGRQYKNVQVVGSQGKLLFLIPKGKEDGSNLWIPVDRTKDQIIGLKYPIIGERSLRFTDLNVLTFTTLDKDNKVQKYSDNGNRDANGDKVLVFYLPTSKTKAKPTPLQTEFNNLRMSIVEGNRVKISAPIQGQSITESMITTEQADGTSQVSKGDYYFEFSMEQPTEVVATEEEVFVEEKIKQTVVEKMPPSQETTVAAVEKMIAESSQIPDPTKVGYMINGKRYERQSGFVKRVLGDNQVQTEDSIQNMELGAAVGNFLDIIGRDVLGGKKVKTLAEYLEEARKMGKSLRQGAGYDLLITQVQFDELVAELQGVAKELTDKGWKVYTEGLIVHREFTPEEKEETGLEGVAGAMDILAVDPEGKVHIIDFKNKKFKTTDLFTTTLYSSGRGYPSNVSKWSTQQTTYAILSDDFGLPVDSINILAFASEYSEENGVITIDNLTLGSKKADVAEKHKSPISDSIIRLGYDMRIIKHINLRTQKPEVAPTTPSAETLDKIKENLPEYTTQEIENVASVLSSLNINLDSAVGFILPEEGSTDPDAINPPPCS